MSNVVPEELRSKLSSEGKFLVSTINYDVIKSIEKWILQSRIGDKPRTEMILVINSSGGSPGVVLYFASFLATLSDDVKIKGVAYGECGSAALALLQCCHERIAVNHCGFFIHNIQTNITVSCQETSLPDVQRQMEASRKTENELVELQTKRCGMTKNKWRKLATLGQNTPGRAIFPMEAKQLGLVDKVVGKYPLF